MRTACWCSLAGTFICQALLAADVPPAPDYSSPEKTWSTVCAALKAEDLTAFRACFHNSNEMSRLFMAAYSDMTVTTFKLANVASLIPGQGKQFSQKLQGVYTELVESGLNRKTAITGDVARWARVENSPKGPAEQVIFFKKINDKWLISTEDSYSLDTAEGRKAAEDFIDSSAKKLPTLKKLIADIQANKITSLDELRKRLFESSPI